MPGRLQVYLVEDSPILRKLFTSAIVGAGAKVVGWSADARTAIAELRDLQPDAVIIDISLASGSGFDVLRALREESWADDVLKVVLTNHVSQEYRELGFALGADRYFDKSRETAQAIRFIAGLAEAASRGASRARETSATRAHS